MVPAVSRAGGVIPDFLPLSASSDVSRLAQNDTAKETTG
jgi:hypothetical protein